MVFEKSKPEKDCLTMNQNGLLKYSFMLAIIISLIGCNNIGSSESNPTISSVNTETITSITEGPLGIGSIRVSPKDSMTMVYVPAGDFLMGSPEGIGNINEHPQHTVNLDAYWIDQTEVTNAMYSECAYEGGCTSPHSSSTSTRPSYYRNRDFDDYPMVNVDWNQVKEYCTWAGRRLPTEAEWEKAARGTDGQSYPWSSVEIISNLANYGNNVGDTTQVGSYSDGASPYGAYDMVGNVEEMVADWFDANYYQNSPANNPQGPSTGDLRVWRGGSWNSDPIYLFSANRDSQNPTVAWYDIGFRCALDAGVSP